MSEKQPDTREAGGEHLRELAKQVGELYGVIDKVAECVEQLEASERAAGQPEQPRERVQLEILEELMAFWDRDGVENGDAWDWVLERIEKLRAALAAATPPSEGK